METLFLQCKLRKNYGRSVYMYVPQEGSVLDQPAELSEQVLVASPASVYPTSQEYVTVIPSSTTDPWVGVVTGEHTGDNGVVEFITWR